MNYQTSQPRRTVYGWMLLVQTSKEISEPGQAYKMGIFTKIVNGLKFILRFLWWTLRVYLVGHLYQWYEWSNLSEHWKNHLLRAFQSLGSWWPIESIVTTGFLQLLKSLGSLFFYLFLVSINFPSTSYNLVSMAFRSNTSSKNAKPIYVIKRASGLGELLI